MRRLLTLAVAAVFALPSVAAAQAAPAKPDSTKKEEPASHLGSWRGSVSTEQGNQEVWMTVKKDGDKLSGTTGSQMGETPLYDISIKGDTLSAGASMQTPNGNFDLWYTMILKGQTLTGSIDLNIQGQKLSLPVALRKQP
jgi:opacity protein-like surface antigen